MSAEQPVPPSEAVREEMREHLEAEHRRGFEAKRDVFYEGNQSPDAVFTHRPETAASAEGFSCELCGRTFLSALEPGLSEERITYLARNDSELARLLAEAGVDQRTELVKAHRSERSAAALLERRRRRERLQTVKPQPAAAARRQRAQAYLLATYEEIGNVEEALWSLAQLRIRDPKAYRQIMGDEHDYKIGTLDKYWQEIPLAEREAAKQRFLDRQRPG